MVRFLALLLSAGLISAATAANTPATDAAGLGGPELTPVGAEHAANAAGTIPAWTGGITEPVSGYAPGDRHTDPYTDDPVLFTITAANMDAYADQLSEGQKALLERYPDSWHMNVYASRRSAAYPDFVYAALKSNASSAAVIEEGRGAVEGSVVTSPFPRPKQGLEVIWNHILRWRGVHIIQSNGAAALTRKGNYTAVLRKEEWAIPYARNPDHEQENRLPNMLLSFKQKIYAPGFVNGFGSLTLDFIDQNKSVRENWIYSPTLRRIFRAPFSGYDNPALGSDGLRFTDENDMYNGSPSLFDWELLGKREIYIPYNAYRLHSGERKIKDILEDHHINPDHARYELHRVWVVEAKLKTGKGSSHKYSRRVFYIDEDSWQIAVADNYDKQGQLWRYSEGHMINFYEVPAPWYTLLVFHDFKQQRYLVEGLDNKSRPPEFDEAINPRLFGPSALDFYVR